MYSPDYNFLYEFCRFRTLNHKLPIESGRWQNADRNMRICKLCDKNENGDEFHYILECNDDRFRRRPNMIKFGALMSIKNQFVDDRLCYYIQGKNLVI